MHPLASSMLASLLVPILAGSAAIAAPTGVGWADGPTELGLHVSHLRLEDDASKAQLQLGGMSVRLRHRISRRWGIEAAADALFAEQLSETDLADEVVRVSVPLTVNGLVYLFPDSAFQLYGSFGVGIAGHTVEYKALGERMGFATPLATAGFGAQYRFDDLRFDLSLRGMMMHREDGDIDIEPLDPDETERRTVDYRPLRGDRDLTGVMLSFGIMFGL